ncbi:hypothetical protein ACOSP7_015179 [Xanthoceras sorbifolium]
MEEESKRQRKQNDGDSFSAAKRPRPLSDGDGGEDVMAWLSMDEDAVGDELMKLLDSTEANTVGELTRVKFIDNPYSSTFTFQSSSSYITINGNEESCGSSFSDKESSVMASVDRGGIVNDALAGVEEWLKELEGGACCSNEVEASGWIVDEDEDEGGTGTGTGGLLKGGMLVGWDGSDLDDYVLARFLGEDAAF